MHAVKTNQLHQEYIFRMVALSVAIATKFSTKPPQFVLSLRLSLLLKQLFLSMQQITYSTSISHVQNICNIPVV